MSLKYGTVLVLFFAWLDLDKKKISCEHHNQFMKIQWKADIQ